MSTELEDQIAKAEAAWLEWYNAEHEDNEEGLLSFEIARELPTLLDAIKEKIADLEASWNMLHWSCDNLDHEIAYNEMARALGYKDAA